MESKVGFVSIDVVMNASSIELINMLANRGFCDKYSGENDKRKAYVAEVATMTSSGKTYVKIVVSVNDEFTYDFGVRLYIN